MYAFPRVRGLRCDLYYYYYLATLAATHHLLGIYLHFWKMKAVLYQLIVPEGNPYVTMQRIPIF